MSKALIDFLVSWGPMFLLIAAWIYFIKRSGALNQSAKMDLTNKLLVELNTKLDRIAAALEKNSARDG